MKRSIGILGVSLAVAGLFGIAGTVAWWNAWVFIVFIVVLGGFTSRIIKTTPGLEEERRTAAAKAKPWDAMLVRLINLALPVMVLIAALDYRLRLLPPMSAAASLGALAVMIPATILTYRAIASNRFFSSHIRIQSDRGQVVVSAGPYRFIRHPGYAGSIAFNLLVPFVLGSWTALLPGLGTALLLVYRTDKEDRTLMTELPGYTEYAQQVRNRLIPGVW